MVESFQITYQVGAELDSGDDLGDEEDELEPDELDDEDAGELEEVEEL